MVGINTPTGKVLNPGYSRYNKRTTLELPRRQTHHPPTVIDQRPDRSLHCITSLEKWGFGYSDDKLGWNWIISVVWVADGGEYQSGDTVVYPGSNVNT